MAETRKRPLGQMRAWIGRGPYRRGGPGSRGNAGDGRAGRFLGSLAAGDTERRRVPAPARRWGRQRPDSDLLGCGPADRTGGCRVLRPGPTHRQRRGSRGRRTALRLRRPALGGQAGACPRTRQRAGSEDPAGQERCPAAAWSNFLKLVVRRYGPRGSILDGESRDCPPARSASGRFGTRRTSSTSSCGRTQPTTASWSTSPTARSGASTGRQADPRWDVRAAERGEVQGQAPAGLFRG